MSSKLALFEPKDIIHVSQSNEFIIADTGNNRLVKWSADEKSSPLSIPSSSTPLTIGKYGYYRKRRNNRSFIHPTAIKEQLCTQRLLVCGNFPGIRVSDINSPNINKQVMSIDLGGDEEGKKYAASGITSTHSGDIIAAIKTTNFINILDGAGRSKDIITLWEGHTSPEIMDFSNGLLAVVTGTTNQCCICLFDQRQSLSKSIHTIFSHIRILGTSFTPNGLLYSTSSYLGGSNLLFFDMRNLEILPLYTTFKNTRFCGLDWNGDNGSVAVVDFSNHCFYVF